MAPSQPSLPSLAMRRFAMKKVVSLKLFSKKENSIEIWSFSSRLISEPGGYHRDWFHGRPVSKNRRKKNEKKLTSHHTNLVFTPLAYIVIENREITVTKQHLMLVHR